VITRLQIFTYCSQFFDNLKQNLYRTAWRKLMSCVKFITTSWNINNTTIFLERKSGICLEEWGGGKRMEGNRGWKIYMLKTEHTLSSKSRTRKLPDWRSGDSQDFYSGGGRVESRLGHELSWRVSWLTSVYPGKFRDSTSIVSRLPLPSKSFIGRPAIDVIQSKYSMNAEQSTRRVSFVPVQADNNVERNTVSGQHLLWVGSSFFIRVRG
jgi:hypothetical protein